MLNVGAGISIPLAEIHFTYARSGGPGGQNVNKVASKAILRWHPSASTSLPGDVKTRFLARFKNRLNAKGELVISCDSNRDQPRNRAECLKRLKQLILQAARPPRIRRKTRPTWGSIQRTRRGKQQRSRQKQLRKPPERD